jgi:hypothetical protein
MWCPMARPLGFGRRRFMVESYPPLSPPTPRCFRPRNPLLMNFARKMSFRRRPESSLVLCPPHPWTPDQVRGGNETF